MYVVCSVSSVECSESCWQATQNTVPKATNIFGKIIIILRCSHTKRGRPSKRFLIQSEILNVLSSSATPLTIAYIAKTISGKLGRRVNWNTVRKYVDELVNADKVQPIDLPHSKKEDAKGLTVYILKK